VCQSGRTIGKEEPGVKVGWAAGAAWQFGFHFVGVSS
jgi:hypothetical protein